MLTKIIAQANVDHAEKWFEKAEKIVIVSHVSPDGDAIGSSLGLYHFLNTQGKSVNVIVPNQFPDFLKWMPGSKEVVIYDKYKEFADIIKRDFDMEMNDDFLIEYGPIDLLDKGIVYTSLLANDVWEYDSEMGYFEDTTNLTYFEANELLRLNYLRLTEDTELIYKLIIRLVNFYVPLLDVVGWFSYEDTSDSVKVMLTKYFDLPAPLETYDFYDIFCTGYRILEYLNDNVNLTGDYPQDE